MRDILSGVGATASAGPGPTGNDRTKEEIKMNAVRTVNDRNLIALFKCAFPASKCRKIWVNEFHGPKSLNSYWDGGCRDFFQLLDLNTLRQIGSIPQNGTPFDGQNLSLSALPEGYALCVHVYSGSNVYGQIYFNAANLTKFLPAPATVTAEGSK